MSHHKITCLLVLFWYAFEFRHWQNAHRINEREREKTTHTNYPTDSNLNEQKQKQETKKKKLNRQILFEKKKHNNEEPNERIM